MGGGLVLADLDDSSELHRLVAHNPFTAFMDVEVIPVIEPTAAMETWGEVAAALTGAAHSRRTEGRTAHRHGASIDDMQSIAFACPLLVGQTDAIRIALASCWVGARREAYQDARRRAGIVREAVWIQPTPGGDLAVVYLEADDLATAFTILGTSPDPFDCWFRDHVRQVHGFALEDGLTTPELVLDFDINRI